MNVHYTRMTDPDNSQPIYERLAAQFREKIATGEWPRDYKLPAEADLAAELSVARGTLRKAIKLLIDEHLMRQVHGKGTFVTGSSVALPLAERLLTLHELLDAAGASFATELLSLRIERGDDQSRALLHMEDSEKLFWMRRRLRLSSGPGIIVENSVRIALCPGLERADFTKHRLFDVIAETSGSSIEWGRRDFSAEQAGKQVADLLGIDEKDPVLYLAQITYLSGARPVERSEIWVEGQSIRISTILKR